MKIKVKYYEPIINFPDYQARLFKNNKKIRWIKPVHEILENYTSYASLPPNYNLIHIKSLKRQIQQNQLYSTL